MELLRATRNCLACQVWHACRRLPTPDIQLYSTNLSALWAEFMEENGDALRSVKTNKSTIVLEDFNVHIGNNFEVWKSVIAWHSDADVNNNRRLLLQQCFRNALCIMNFLPTQRCTQVHLVKRFFGQLPLIDQESLHCDEEPCNTSIKISKSKRG